MPSYTYGGRSRCDFYRLKWNGTAYQVLDKLTDTIATNPSTTHIATALQYIASTKLAFQDDGTLQVTFDQYEADEELFQFLDTVAKPTSGGGLQEITLEDGTKIGGASAAGDPVLMVSYLHYDDIQSPTKVFVLAAIGTISPTSGSFETSSDNLTKPSIEFRSTKARAAFTISAAMLQSGIVTTSDQLIPATAAYIRKYLPKA